MKQLVVNADDFGFTRDVNRGIVTAHTDGILTATTLMANGGAFDDAVNLAIANPSLDIGCHLVMIGGNSLLDSNRALPRTVPELVRAVLLGRVDPYSELRAQIQKILSAGLQPTHLDTHKHTHLMPQVLDAVARLSEEFSIRWVRRPFDYPLSGAANKIPPLKRFTSRALQLVRNRFHARLTKHGCRTTDYFAGFQLTGRFESKELAMLFGALPEGSVEFMCHPGFCTSELRGAPTRLKESRERELNALTDPAVRAVIEQQGVIVTNYRNLA